ncbi:MAG: hypothetical protein M3277_04405 [Actinomycetota bacterium]|nr:hypothetical protein [Actinomycetota bacterium]
MSQAELPEWESLLIDEAITAAERRLAAERARARRRAVQLAREQGYHRLAVAIDRQALKPKPNPDQLSFFPVDPTLFDAS